MRPHVTELFRDQAGQFVRGELNKIVAAYAMPTAVYFEDRMTVMSSPAQFTKALADHRETLLEGGMHRMEASVFAESLRRGVHWSVWVKWTHFCARNRTLGASTARYFCKCHGHHTFQIQIMEYTKPPFTGTIPHLSLDAVS